MTEHTQNQNEPTPDTEADELNTLTDEDIKAIESLRSRGFAVIVWTPAELGDADLRRVEDRSIELGWDVIHDLGGPAPDEQ